MPFVSQAQRRFMFATDPKMAHEWAAKTPNMKGLPEHKAKPKPKKRKTKK